MGWAKYFEDDFELYSERMDKLEINKKIRVGLVTAIPVTARPSGFDNAEADKTASMVKLGDKRPCY